MTRQRRFRQVLFASLVVVYGLTIAGSTTAAPSKTSSSSPKGLLIAPATQFVSANAGSQKSESLTVGNYTDNTINVNLVVKQFSVNSLSYTYNFSPPSNDWIKLSLNQVTLAPGDSRSVAYTIQVPAGSPPGGSYYTILASSTLTTGGLKSTGQAASLLYITVNGKLVRTGHLESESIQRVSFGTDISYHFNVINTGNVYYFIYVAGALHGLTAKSALTSGAHLVIPGKERQFIGSIPHPTLPGMYRATYGYKTDTGSVVNKSQWVVYIPAWSIAALVVLLLALNLWFKRKTRR